ncbi:MAG: phosphomannomutase, partial [Deltaproteobacteria bacterium]|nr:phosphomannomutase [Deltaproteobacteria bacterium]
LIKRKMKEVGAILAGEMSGHIFIADRYYGFDDAVYACVRLIEMISNGFDPKNYLESLPKLFNTPEIRIEVDEDLKFKLIDALKDCFKDYEINTTDGVRVNFGDGWALVRASNTQPAIILRFEASSQESLEHIQKLVHEQVMKNTDILQK